MMPTSTSKPPVIVQIVPALNSGGVERGVVEISAGIIKCGWRSIVISNGGPLVATLLAQGAEHITMPIGEKKLRVIGQIKKLAQTLEQINPHLVHVCSRLPAWVLHFSKKYYQSPCYVTSCHAPHTIGKYSEIMTSGQKVIAISNFIQNYIATHYPQANHKVTVIKRAVNPDDFQSIQPETALNIIQRRHAEVTSDNLLVFPARFSKGKGQMRLLHILAKLPKTLNYQVIMMGKTEPNKQQYLKSLKQTAMQLDIAEKVVWLPAQSDVQSYIGAAKATLCLSEKPEGHGRVPLESCYMGIPVFGWDIGGVSESLSAYYPEGLVAAFNEQAMVEKLQNALENSLKPPIRDVTLTSELQFKTLKLYQALMLEQSCWPGEQYAPSNFF